MYKIVKEEQETTIGWDAATKTADIFSADTAVIRKLDQLAAQYPDIYKCTKEDTRHGSKFYQVPVKYIRFSKPASEKRKEASRNALCKGMKTASTSGGASMVG